MKHKLELSTFLSHGYEYNGHVYQYMNYPHWLNIAAWTKTLALVVIIVSNIRRFRSLRSIYDAMAFNCQGVVKDILSIAKNAKSVREKFNS